MKVLFVCGSYPPETCSNADTAEIIVELLRKSGVDVEVLSNIDWGIKSWFKIRAIVKNANADVIHMQYPGLGYKHSLTPQMLAFVYRRKTLVTIHEVSQLHPLRKLALMPFSWCNRVLFTNIYESEYYCKIYPWTNKNNVSILPIGSNIHAITNLPVTQRGLSKIIHFGQIRPEKGIEAVIELAKLIKESELPFTTVIMGRTYDKFYGFYEQMKSRSENLPVEWILNESEEKVSEVLGSNMLAYLPYPDGASERRGSMFAAMVHNMFIFTTKGPHSPAGYEKMVNYVDTPVKMLEILKKQQTELDEFAKKIPQQKKYIKSLEWPEIVKKHIDEYGIVLKHNT